MADQSLGFKFRFTMHGGPPWIQELTIKDTETLSKGDMVEIDGGEIDLAVTTDDNVIGMVLETKAGTDSTTTYQVIVDPFAVYGVYDANARALGDTLDVAGTTGAQTVGSSSGKEFVVVAPSAADEETLVMINRDIHPFTKTS
jgi:hypothetical protein